jgi:hypothetical protein
MNFLERITDNTTPELPPPTPEQLEAQAAARVQETHLRQIEAEDQRARRNVQWGIVRGLFLYSLLMVPVAFVIAIILHQ